MHERGHRVAWRIVYGYSLRLQMMARLGDLRAGAHPARHEGHAGSLYSGSHRSCRLHGCGEGGRAVERQDRVGVRISQQGGERVAIALSRCIAEDVHRVAMAPTGWQDRIERTDRRRCQIGKPATFIHQGVGRQHAEPTAVAQDRQTIAADRRHPAQEFGRVEHLAQRSHTEHARPAERGGIHGIDTGERSCVGGDGPCAFRVAASLENDDRLVPAGGPRGGHELPRMGERFHVEEDGSGPGILRQIVEQIAEIDIGHGADRNQMGKADVPH